MFFSEEDIITILKRLLPNANYKDLDGVARSIMNEAEHWQEVDLNEYVRDETEREMLHDFCRRKSKNGGSPRKIRVFFKE
jgi:hypothetical protein